VPISAKVLNRATVHSACWIEDGSSKEVHDRNWLMR
jgi:hypothetical protein